MFIDFFVSLVLLFVINISWSPVVWQIWNKQKTFVTKSVSVPFFIREDGHFAKGSTVGYLFNFSEWQAFFPRFISRAMGEKTENLLARRNGTFGQKLVEARQRNKKFPYVWWVLWEFVLLFFRSTIPLSFTVEPLRFSCLSNSRKHHKLNFLSFSVYRKVILDNNSTAI